MTSKSSRPRSQKTSETGKPRSSPGTWVTIGEACDILGVDQSTLRRWSDEGRIPVFLTPGGHRRFSRQDLDSLVAGELKRSGKGGMGRRELTNRSLSAYEDDYLKEARTRKWHRAFGAEMQEEHRRIGRHLVDLAIRYAAMSSNAEERARLLDEGRDIGKFYGRSGAEAELAASDTIEAFLYFRYPTVRAMLSVIEEDQIPVRKASRLFIAIDDFIDQVLLSMMWAYESARTQPGNPALGGQKSSE